jgi:hypothetical protein
MQREQEIVEGAVRARPDVPPADMNHRPERQNGEHPGHEEEASDPVAVGQDTRAPLPVGDPAAEQEEDKPQGQGGLQEGACSDVEPEGFDPHPA